MFKKLFILLTVLFSFGAIYPQSITPSEWKVEYFNNPYLNGTPYLSQNLEVPIKYEWWKPAVPGLYQDYFSVRWSGSFVCLADEVYVLRFSSDDGIRIYLDGQIVVNRWYDQKAAPLEKPVYLKKGKHEIKIEFYDTRSLAAISFDIVRQLDDDSGAISGKVTLPGGMKAVSDKEVYLHVVGADGKTYYGYTVVPAGKTGAPFTLNVQSGKAQSYTLSYDTPADICVGKGYYSKNGTAVLKKDAGTIQAGSSPIAGITMELIDGLTVSGKVSVPGDKAAPSGGILLWIAALRDNGDEYVLPVTIPAGKSSIPYGIVVPGSESISMYQIGYSLTDPSYMDNGFYNPTRTVSTWGDSTWLRVTETSLKNIDMDLIKAGIIMGMFVIEKGEKAVSNITLNIQGIVTETTDIKHAPNTPYSKYVVIPKGENSAPFSIKLPSDFEENTFHLRYFCGEKGFQRVGYYSKNGTLKYADRIKGAQFVTDGSLYQDIKFTVMKDPNQLSTQEEILLGKEKVKSIVKEYIKPGMTDYEKTMILHDYLCQNSVYGWDEVTSSIYTILCKGIGECGSHSHAMSEMLTEAGVECKIVGGVGHVWNMVKIDGKWYYLDATYDDDGEKFLNYSCFLLTEAQLIYMGHSWKKDGYPDSDDPFVFKEEYMPNKKLLKNDKFFRIMGNIYLPDGETAGEKGVEIRLWGYTFFIPPGKNSTPYILTYHKEAKDAESIISMAIKNNQSYITWGFIGKDGYTAYRDQAILYKNDGKEDIIGFDLTLKKGISVTGKISLPDGVAAPKNGVKVWMNVFDQDKKALAWPSYKIPYGETSVEYSMGVAEGGYYFGVQDTDFPALYGNSYYSESGGVLMLKDAGVVQVGKTPKSGIDIVLSRSVPVKGKVTLPKGEKAPSGGIKVYPMIWDMNLNRMDWISVIIPEGSNSMEYTIPAPPVEFLLGLDWIPGDYIAQGFYSKGGMVYDQKKAQYFKANLGTVIEGINLSIEKGVILSGKVVMPSGMSASKDGLKVWVGLYDENKNRIKSPSFFIPEGQNSVEYKIVMPKENPTAKYYLGYLWTKGYVSSGYYSKNGTVFDFKDATLFDTSKGNIKNIDIELYRGFEVTGSFILPNGQTAPKGGLKVSFTKYEEDKNHQSWWSHVIPEGENKLDFTYNFLPGKYYFAYRYVDGYVNPGFYSKKGFTGKIDEAELVDLTKKDASGIDLYLFEGAKISGKLVLPKGELAPKDGIKIWINIWGTNMRAVTWPGYTIPEGENSVPYSINLMPGLYYAGYNEVVPEVYVNKQIYSKSGMTPYFDKGTIFDLTKKGVSGIELQVFKGLKVWGTVTLPKGDTAPAGGVSVWLNLWDVNKKAMIWPKITVPEGKNSVDFEISYLKGEYYLGMNGVSDPKYKGWGLYSKQGMVDNWNETVPVKLFEDLGGYKIQLEKK